MARAAFVALVLVATAAVVAGSAFDQVGELARARANFAKLSKYRVVSGRHLADATPCQQAYAAFMNQCGSVVAQLSDPYVCLFNNASGLNFMCDSGCWRMLSDITGMNCLEGDLSARDCSLCGPHQQCVNNMCADAACTRDADCGSVTMKCNAGKCVDAPYPCGANGACGCANSCVHGMCVPNNPSNITTSSSSAGSNSNSNSGSGSGSDSNAFNAGVMNLMCQWSDATNTQRCGTLMMNMPNTGNSTAHLCAALGNMGCCYEWLISAMCIQDLTFPLLNLACPNLQYGSGQCQRLATNCECHARVNDVMYLRSRNALVTSTCTGQQCNNPDLQLNGQNFWIVRANVGSLAQEHMVDLSGC